MLFRLRALLLMIVTILLLPIMAALFVFLLVSNLFYRITGFTRNRAPQDAPPGSRLASIIVLNWNGKDLLARGIPSIIRAVETDGRPHEILVVDNGSTDGSVDYLKKNYPEVRVLPLGQNLGFAEGNNAGARAAANDIIVLLNNDMVVDPGFLAPLLDGFGPTTFAVSSQIFLQNPSKRREETGKTTAVFRRGMIDYSHREIPPEPSRSHYRVFWAGGGSSAYDRSKFLFLGGFDNIYSPAYVEDTDLSYRAWQTGWETLLAPASIVYHEHRASTNKRFNPTQLQSLITRNQYLFIWKNIHSWRLLLSHGLFLPWNCYRLSRDTGRAAWIGLLKAAATIPAMETSLFRCRSEVKRRDDQIFGFFEKPGLYSCRRYSSTPTPEAKPRILWMTAYLPHTGRHAGAGRMFQLLKRMSFKYRITLLTFLETDEEAELVREVEPYCESVTAMRRSRPPRWQLFAYEPFDEFFTPGMTEAMDQCLEEKDFDLLQLEYTQMACYADRVEGIPSLVTKHEVDYAACARRALQESCPLNKFRWFYNYLQVLDREVKLTRKASAAICMTDPDARELKKFAPSVPVYTINTGVDLEYFQPPLEPATAPRLIFVGAFQHLPNVEAMIYFCNQVLPLIRKTLPQTELLIVGSNPPPQVLSLEATQGIQITGFVPDIRPFMARSSVYVVPLRLGVGIRGKILEAWGMAMPVVSTSVGCAGLRYEDGKNLLVADAPEIFAEQALTLLKDPDKRLRMGQEGRKTAEQYYGWEASAQKLDALYKRYMNRPLAVNCQSAAGNQG